jgi:sulfate adenylyltransferase subunit 1 (EFTu-like GTPase family)
MSVTLTLGDELDISRGDMITSAEGAAAQTTGPEHRSSTLGLQPFVGTHFRAEVVWMDERPLDPSRVYVLKHATRMVKAEVDHGLVLNQIGSITLSTARPIIYDRYADNRITGSFILIDPTTNFTAGAGMISDPLGEQTGVAGRRPSVAERIARVARGASSDAEATAAVRKALEELLS